MKERSGYLTRQKNFIILPFLALLSLPVSAQVDPLSIGAQSWGVANATVASSTAASVFSNIAGLAGTSEILGMSSYDSHYGFEGINTMGFGFVVPLSSDFATGFTLQRFGDKLYNELSMGVGAAHRVDRVCLGIKANYLQKAVNGTNVALSRNTFVIEFGGIVRISERLFLGAHLYNMTQSSYSRASGERVPTILRAGLLCLPLKTVQLSVECEKNTDRPVNLKGGLAYQAFKKIWLRTGLATQPMTHHFGAGFRERRFSVDYATHFHKQLGLSHHLSLAYHLFVRGEPTGENRQ
jgi:hypothetical protein